MFDQALINQGRVHYVEVGTNVTSDHFVFDVTNGISSLSRLVFNIQVREREGTGQVMTRDGRGRGWRQMRDVDRSRR